MYAHNGLKAKDRIHVGTSAKCNKRMENVRKKLSKSFQDDFTRSRGCRYIIKHLIYQGIADPCDPYI